MTADTVAYRRRLGYDRVNGIRRRVDATQTRAHIERLAARGWTQGQIAAAAGIHQTTVSIVASARHPQVARSTATAILAIRLDQKPPIPRGLTDATGTRRRLQALMVLGYTLPDITTRAGITRGGLHQTLDGRWECVRTTTAGRVARVYRQLSVLPSPVGRTAELARNHAMGQGWHGPMAWADIDDPQCVPEPTTPGAPSSVHPDDVAELAGCGLDDLEIGRRLGVSPRTVLRARTAHNIPAGVTE
ncbi:hypothetical protein [Streptomyces sp. NPDC005799]|uniref:helix-turn-helix domain-containing protein n=1 Tax=Streptomyces sp. NPDC005799 TaxID=3154678 RepID=UPI003400E093